MHEVMTMTQEPDYKTAYEILEEALRNADRILRQAQLRTALRLERERDPWEPADPELAPDDVRDVN